MIQFYAVDGPVTNDHNLKTYLFDPTLLEAESELHTVHFAAPEGEDRGADEVAAGAGSERQQGRSATSISPLHVLSPFSRVFNVAVAVAAAAALPLLRPRSRRFALRRKSGNLSRPRRAWILA